MTRPPRLVLVLGDQLSEEIAALRSADAARDIVVMAEVMAEATYAPHHPKKIAFILSAMRKFAQSLRTQGWTVAYTTLDDPANTGTIAGELLRRAQEHGAQEVIATQPGEWRLIEALDAVPLTLRQLPDDRFICSQGWFALWAKGRKVRRMEHFYREMRHATGLLMEGDAPAGGKWNFDHDNRKPARADMLRAGPLRTEPDAVTAAVLDLVEARFDDHFGTLRPFHFATDRAGALRALDHFVTHALPEFGSYQDAMLCDDRFLNHAVIGLYLNAGLLGPMEVCRRVEAAWREGQAPINAAEGFIRQIIGWREFIRATYFHEGPSYAARNALGHARALPPLYWGAPTRMNCLSHVIAQTRDEAYAHHIQRLMITGNFALLAGVAPQPVHAWYLAVYADAVEWVEAPNTLGMSQFADGGLIASKPYVSGGAYINRMSDYCTGCQYRVKDRTGPRACPFNQLYWHFLTRHRARFAGNPRMARIYRNWDRMDRAHRETVLAEADAFLAKLDAGAQV